VSWFEQEVKRIIREDLPAKWDWIVVPLEVDMDEYAVDGPWVKGE